MRSQAGVGPLRSQGNSSSPGSCAARFLRLKHFPLSRANCPCIFKSLHSLLLSLLSHLMTRFCPADLQLPRPSNFSHSSHELQASFLCSRANTNTMIAVVRGNKLLQEKLSSGEYFRPNLGQDSQIQGHRDSRGACSSWSYCIRSEGPGASSSTYILTNMLFPFP